MLEVTPRLRVPLREIQFEFSRASGPGGQNVNKVSSRATLRWNVTTSPSLPDAVRRRFLAVWASRITRDGEVVITGGRFRDQGRNVADVLERLRQMLLAVATAPKRRKKTRPSRGAVERRLKEKRVRADRKRLRGRRPRGDDD